MTIALQFENDAFNSETTETGNIVSDEIAEEVANPDWVNIFYTQQQKSVETINKLSKDYEQPQQ